MQADAQPCDLVGLAPAPDLEQHVPRKGVGLVPCRHGYPVCLQRLCREMGGAVQGRSSSSRGWGTANVNSTAVPLFPLPPLGIWGELGPKMAPSLEQ